MNHASLFSGIGGFDLAAEWMGWTNVFNCEWEEFPQQVLKYHFPNAAQYGDIKELDATTYAGRIDILTGGFPCQPYSLAGKRKGKEDERHLWPEMLRVIRECSPRYIVGENVRGLVGWNGGMVFEEVCADLEAEGYSVQPFVLPAAGVGAPHRRDRIWFAAYADDNRTERTSRRDESKGKGQGIQERDEVQQPNKPNPVREFSSDAKRVRLEHGTQPRRLAQIQGQVGRQPTHASEADGRVQYAPDTDYKGLQRSKVTGGTQQSGKERDQQPTRCVCQTWEKFPTVPPVCGGDDGLPKELDGITFSKWRRESIKAYGNAIVPQVAYQIFKAIDQYERLD